MSRFPESVRSWQGRMKNYFSTRKRSHPSCPRLWIFNIKSRRFVWPWERRMEREGICCTKMAILKGKDKRTIFFMSSACNWKRRVETARTSFQRCPETADSRGIDIVSLIHLKCEEEDRRKDRNIGFLLATKLWSMLKLLSLTVNWKLGRERDFSPFCWDIILCYLHWAWKVEIGLPEIYSYIKQETHNWDQKLDQCNCDVGEGYFCSSWLLKCTTIILSWFSFSWSICSVVISAKWMLFTF